MPDPQVFVFGSFRLMSQRRELLLNGDSVQLGSRAFDLLLALVKRQGQLATKDELMAEIWPGTIVEENSLHSLISVLRKVLASDAGGARFLQTVPGRGYRFVARVEHEKVVASSGRVQRGLSIQRSLRYHCLTSRQSRYCPSPI